MGRRRETTSMLVMGTAPRYFSTNSGIMAPQPYQHMGKEEDQAEVIYDEAIYQIPPAFANNNNSFPTDPPGYSVFYPATWQSDMNSMVFMDALQPWGPPTTNGSHLITNDPRFVTMGVGWQQPSPLMAWDMLGRNMAPEPQMLPSAPVHSPYPVQSDPSYERTVFKSEKPLEETWDSGWVEEIPPSLDATMQPAGTIPQAVTINMPVERPPPAHAARKRRRVPSPMVDMHVFTTNRAEHATGSPDAPVPAAVQFTEQQHTAPHTTNMYMEYGHISVEPPAQPAPQIQQFQPQSGGRSHPREPTPTLEELPEYGMADNQSQPTSSGPMSQSPTLSTQFIGPVATSRNSTSKVRRGTHTVFKTQSANSKRGHYASNVWEGHKAAIKKLYIDEGKPLREVIKIMDTEHNFPAT